MLRLCLLLALAAYASAAPRHQTTKTGKNGPSKAQVRALFTANGTAGSYPAPSQVPTPLKQWVRAYDAAKKAHLIADDIPLTSMVDDSPVYPSWYKGNPCSYYGNDCAGPRDILTGSRGVAGIAFDDGPKPPTLLNLDTLKSKNVPATHFLIGSNIKLFPSEFEAVVESGGHLAVHTWSHPYLTTLSDHDIVAELGWTIQIIFDRTGELPAFWRPPYGEVDSRVRSIAQNVFRLQTVMWSHDPHDWCLDTESEPHGSSCTPDEGPQTLNQLEAEMKHFIYSTPKSHGILILNHEISTRETESFSTAVGYYRAKGWKLKTVADAKGLPWYQ